MEITTTPPTATAAPEAQRFTANYEMFLTLLTTQLRNQNPLQPLDANQFTQQLVQYSSVEQQIKTNQSLDALKASLAAANAMNMVSYVGATVTADGAQTKLTGGLATWQFRTERPVAAADIVVRDAAGQIVFRETRSIPAGTNAYVWNGRTTTGGLAPDGVYQISIAGRDQDGNAVPVQTTVTGIVDEVDFSGSEPVLRIGDLRVTLSSIRSVKRNT